MTKITVGDSQLSLDGHVFRNLGTAALVEAALAHGEGALSVHGALVVKTGAHTGRSAKD